jgi:2-polyprenyl-3-methyl-5-hydroxy-6-metoxy-1,4-benzoquinol methylase
VYDSWLSHYYSGLLEDLDARCRRREALDYAWFRELDDDLWAILLRKEYSVYPNLRAALPDLPEREVQEEWNGRSGIELASQSAEFYKRLKLLQGRHGAVPLSRAVVLDFGCGWGRHIRFLARDVAPGNLCGCDPYPGILDVCERTRVPGRLASIPYVTDSLPFTDRFDLVYAFSVFTHLSEATHEASLRAIHGGLAEGGLLIATIRPPAYVRDRLHEALPRASAARKLERGKPAYLFAAHDAQPSGGEVTFGEAVVNLPYVRERWGELFELVDVSLMLDDIYQVVLTLRRR